VRAKLDLKWSPQQISRYLARSYPGQPAMQACAETIYAALFAGALGKRAGKLRTGRSRRKAHRRGVAVPNKIKNMKLLAQRPAEVTERRVPGHWEGDLIIGSYGSALGPAAIGTLVESHQVPRPGAPARWLQGPAAARRADRPDPAHPRGLAQDPDLGSGPGDVDARADRRGDRLRRVLLRPAFPWQRGLNENTNGLLRQYFPKHTDLSVHTARDLQQVAAELNQRPRLALADKTPEEAMRALLIS
jgi:IS30 family transposase